MKHIFLLSFLLLTLSATAQVKKDTASIGFYGSKGSSRPVIMDRSSAKMEFVSYNPDSSFSLYNIDSAKAIKILVKNLMDIQKKENEVREYLQKAVDFSNTLPEIYKKGKAWNEYLAALKKAGYSTRKINNP